MVNVLVAGAINWDTTIFISEFPRAGGEAAVSKIKRVPGGKGGNVAVAAAKILGPGRVAIFGALGNDPIGKEHLRIFKQYGIDTSTLSLLAKTDSGQAYILVDEHGENLILTHFGANGKVGLRHRTRRTLSRLMSRASILVVRDPPLRAARDLLRMARDRVGLRVWDPGIRALRGMRPAQEIVSDVDYLVANEIEIEWLTGRSNPNLAARRLRRVNPHIRLIVTLGARGSHLIGDSEQIRMPAVKLSRLGLKVVNTVGCGDAFVGVFSAAKAEGLEDKEALHWASVGAAIKASRWETRGSPNRKELEYYLRRVPA